MAVPCEDVGELHSGGDAKDPNVTGSDTLVGDMQVDLPVLRALMLHKIGVEVDRADVVAVEEGGTLEGVVELLEKLTKPVGLCHAVGHSAVLGLCAGARDRLTLGSLGDEVGTKEQSIVGSGTTRFWIANTVNVSVDHELRHQKGVGVE
jgi:hypothetical protein